MPERRGKSALISLIAGLVTAFGAAIFLAVVLAVLQIYLSGHNLSLWGFGADPEQPRYNWPALLLVIGSVFCGFVTAAISYRARQR